MVKIKKLRFEIENGDLLPNESLDFYLADGQLIEEKIDGVNLITFKSFTFFKKNEYRDEYEELGYRSSEQEELLAKIEDKKVTVIGFEPYFMISGLDSLQLNYSWSNMPMDSFSFVSGNAVRKNDIEPFIFEEMNKLKEEIKALKEIIEEEKA